MGDFVQLPSEKNATYSSVKKDGVLCPNIQLRQVLFRSVAGYDLPPLSIGRDIYF